MTLLHSEFPTFFSYSFDDRPQDAPLTANAGSSSHHHYGSIVYKEVDTSNKFIHFLKTRFIQRNHMHMLLSSNATRNEDRFNAILPSWNRYKHLIENKNTISEWDITSMTSVRLKLYEFMDNIWDKAALLYACSHHSHQQQQQKKRVIILPSYASGHSNYCLHLVEESNPELAYERYLSDLMNYGTKMFGNDDDTLQHILYNGNKFGSLYTKNLKNIQWHSSYLAVESKKYFVRKIEKGELDQDFLSTYSLCNDDDSANDDIRYVCVPFFTFTIPDFHYVAPRNGSRIHLLGNMDQNRWILAPQYCYLGYSGEALCRSDKYTFHLY
ncbi:hypothetical protein BJ944DRAFT_273463 [Cunninghamella echinulata]|nr:hypothetical protein BJ944DRAFT_273463 [Cunninghamella echinulata]